MFWRTNFAKSPGIILKSQAAASRQGEVAQCHWDLTKHITLNALNALAAADLSVPNASNASANRGSSLKQLSQYGHSANLTLLDKSILTAIPFFCAMPRCLCSRMGHRVPRFQGTHIVQWDRAYLASTRRFHFQLTIYRKTSQKKHSKQSIESAVK